MNWKISGSNERGKHLTTIITPDKIPRHGTNSLFYIHFKNLIPEGSLNEILLIMDTMSSKQGLVK